MSKRQAGMLLIAALFPVALEAFVMLAMSVMAAFLVPVDLTGILRLWPVGLAVAVPSYVIVLLWLIERWRA